MKFWFRRVMWNLIVIAVFPNSHFSSYCKIKTSFVVIQLISHHLQRFFIFSINIKWRTLGSFEISSVIHDMSKSFSMKMLIYHHTLLVIDSYDTIIFIKSLIIACTVLQVHNDFQEILPTLAVIFLRTYIIKPSK